MEKSQHSESLEEADSTEQQASEDGVSREEPIAPAGPSESSSLPVGPGAVRVAGQGPPRQRPESVALAVPVAVATNVNNSSAVQTSTVSLPVGSIITNGATLNIINAEQLATGTAHTQPVVIQTSNGQFKQMLCVDNGFICESRPEDKSDPLRWNGELNTIVIRNTDEAAEITPLQITSSPTTTTTPSAPASNYNWSESANLAVLPIRCKNTNAELHKNRFGSGGRGRCIKLNNQWYTPSEFEALCGRASSKDWKRSIRFGGRSLQTLIDEQILRPHATSCTCAACCDDDNAAGPIRLFTPYKRKRRSREPLDGDLRRSRRGDSTNGSDNDDSSNDVLADKTWPQFVSTDEIVIQHNQDGGPIITSVQTNAETSRKNKIQRLEEDIKDAMKILHKCVNTLQELKNEERRESRRDLITQLNRGEVIAASLQPTTDPQGRRCNKCGREAYAECSNCRRTPYCSTDCQREDWTDHQAVCENMAREAVTNEQQNQSQHQPALMLIVESSSIDPTTIAGVQTAGS